MKSGHLIADVLLVQRAFRCESETASGLGVWIRRLNWGSIGRRHKLTINMDHGKDPGMDRMAISKFKATCLATLERVRRTGRPIRVTRFGKPVADIVPTAPEPAAKGWLGSMRDTGRIVGDITEPTSRLAEWDALT